ncbi:alpha/beta fold hydrolase [Lentzea sp. NBRC 102530]|uniref:alpha/beta hydrolase family protein n=1 Tax=Lentzea sp. NBRC 102530 TaxID=3032201 RepID=UPI0024A36221|nr:alpha/beta fold hydrolase [Lentzea sp. NBRC 102530]GLY47026.1 acyl-CoA thioester hydrolase [Lentzea sp. NBRC 102530]
MNGTGRDVEITITADGHALPGTLTLPPGPGPHPAVLCLPGSGKVDRDSNAGRMRVELGVPLSQALARNGIASLRYDRRGVGASPGDWRAAGFLDNRADAALALRTLRDRPEIGGVGVLGHSEGAVHAMWLGAHERPDAVVLLAGYARPGGEALRWQAERVAGTLPKIVRPLPGLLAARLVARLEKTTTDVARVGGVRLNARWWREQLAHDPRADLPGITAPTLAITGEKDLQVDPADLEVIASLVPGAEVRRVPGLTHVLRRDPGSPALTSYARLLRRPVDPELLTEVADWLARRLSR